MNSSLKKNIGTITKFQMRMSMLMLFIGVGVMLLNLVIGAIIHGASAGEDVAGGSIDVMVLVYALVFGIIFFTVSFKFALVNGASRLALFLSGLVSLGIAALFLSLTGGGLIYLSKITGSTANIYDFIYGQTMAGLIPWLLGGSLFCGALGWLIAAILYRTDKTAKFILAGSLIALVPLFILVNYLAGGAPGRGLLSALKSLTGFGMAVPNPFICMATMLVLALLCLGGTYLLLRRAPIREK